MQAPARSLRVLFVAAEMTPLVKVGGLADVVAALPQALVERGHEVRVLLPAYGAHMTGGSTRLMSMTMSDGHTSLAELRRPDLPCPVWLFESPAFAGRGHHPYSRPDGTAWPDDARAFGEFGRVAAGIAAGTVLPDWQPDIVHCHDWHTGLAPAWMRLEPNAAASVFTIHNLAFTGRFHPRVLAELGLPESLNRPDMLEFHGDVAFIKGGLCCADELTTVSPRYAQEILTPEFGNGLEGLLRHRRERLTGILNGIDSRLWNPASDPLIEHAFDDTDLTGKSRERVRLLRRWGVAATEDEAVLGWVGRLTRQKGADLLLDALPELFQRPLRLVVLGSGEPELEQAVAAAAKRWPGRFLAHSRFDEALAHGVYAGADMLAMPSRFEPCGLSQLYAMRYGTVPVTTAVGGLADTVFDADAIADAIADALGLASFNATGFLMARATVPDLIETVDRALTWYRDQRRWQALMRNTMGRDSSWTTAVVAYEKVYESALARRGRGLHDGNPEMNA
ncbi:MAG: glycogen synthase GlgA [Gammaproteobacteria bacterium]|nr:MAG: glycogen synthase GlgA [Gammaproteobacteria bacterium]